MKIKGYLACTALLALVGAAGAYGDPQGEPLFTFCEEEDNDRCEAAQEIDAEIAVSETGFSEADDCFFITGKLQEDCVWDCEPKVALFAYDKPVQCFDDDGDAVQNRFAEPVIASSLTGQLSGLSPLSDRTIRLGVAATSDANDGTINGLASNGPHGVLGEVTIKVFFNGTTTTRGSEPDETYVFDFQNGSDALRVAFQAPSGVSSVDVLACEDTGQVEVCWDTDFYKVDNLFVNTAYCVTVVGGLDEYCEKTDLILGLFDKNCQLIQTSEDNGPRFDGGLAELCVLSDDQGTIRFGVSGTKDRNFNGIRDDRENGLDLLKLLLFFEFDLTVEYTGGASLKDDSDGLVNRLPREVWLDDAVRDFFNNERALTCGNPIESFLEHGSCGEYCIKIRLAEHVDQPSPPASQPTLRELADFDGSGGINSGDLALLLSYWGPVAN